MASCIPIAKKVRAVSSATDQAQFEMSIRAPEGTSAEETDSSPSAWRRTARALPGVAHTVVTVSGGDQQTRNLASVYVALVDPAARAASQQDLMDRARKQILAKLPAELRTSSGEVAAISTARRPRPSVRRLRERSQSSRNEARILGIKKSPAVVDYDTNLIVGKPSCASRSIANGRGDWGCERGRRRRKLLTQIGGTKASSYAEQGEEYDVRVRADHTYRMSAAALSLFTVLRERTERCRLRPSSERGGIGSGHKSIASADSAR